MKLKIFLLFIFFQLITKMYAQDTMYVHLKTGSVNKFATSKIDSIVFYGVNNSPYGSTITDVQGNVYNTIKIGAQTWMKDNLRTTNYNNGDLIFTTTPYDLNISTETNAKYQWVYNGLSSNAATYGRLYTWEVVNDSRKICPTGWHIPTESEWASLEIYLITNNFNYDGSLSGNKYAKSIASASNWLASQNIGSVGNSDYSSYRNKSGFTGLPAGYRGYDGSCYEMYRFAYWWSANQNDAATAWYHTITYDSASTFSSFFSKLNGFSVRCVKN
jgi:uncharacterized protein (TIGR02145 family)